MKKIVLIDDEKEICNLLKATLERAGPYEVFVAYNVKDGQAVCLQHKPELIFLDYCLYDEKADEVINFLKIHAETKDIPIVIMSGMGEMTYSSKKDKWQWLPNSPAALHRPEIPDSLKWKRYSEEAAAEMGVSVYLTKPFSRETLVDLAGRILDISEEKKEKES